jgi:hypothetical protein
MVVFCFLILKYVAIAASFTKYSETMWRSGMDAGLYN